MIRTSKWLKKTRKEQGLSQRQLSELSGVSLLAIAKIENEEQFGTPTTWNKLVSVLAPDAPHVSFDSEIEIEDLKEDIAIHGPLAECTVWYEDKNTYVFFVGYVMDEDFKNMSEVDLEHLNKNKSVRMTLLDALDIFESQDRIF